MYYEEGLDRLAQDEDIISLAGSEIAATYNLNINEMESAAEEVITHNHYESLSMTSFSFRLFRSRHLLAPKVDRAVRIRDFFTTKMSSAIITCFNLVYQV